MPISDYLMRAARKLDAWATAIDPDAVKPTPTYDAGRTAFTRLAQADRTAAPFQSAAADTKAFRDNFTDAYLARCDARCAAAGIERNAAWRGFMEDWCSGGGRFLGARLEAGTNREVYNVVDREGPTRRDAHVVFTCDARQSWRIEAITGACDFAGSLARLESGKGGRLMTV